MVSLLYQEMNKMSYPPIFTEYCGSIEAVTRMTSLRRSILFILWHSQKPLKAYEILDALLENKQNSKPSTVYRVLDHFVTLRLVHKIESIQSYTLCHQPKERLPQEILMVCNRCNGVNEAYDQAFIDTIQKLAKENCFQLGQDVIELKGICCNCN
jgi:Fur family zinc uptake transcriptional regulator